MTTFLPTPATVMTQPAPQTPQHSTIRTIFLVVGPALAAVGLVLTVFGFVSFVTSFGTPEPARNFWLAFAGIPLMGIGVTMWRESRA
jgi:hypothetical protein